MIIESAILIIVGRLATKEFVSAYKSKSTLNMVSPIRINLALFNKNTRPNPREKNVTNSRKPIISVKSEGMLTKDNERSPEIKTKKIIIFKPIGNCLENLSNQPVMCFFESLPCFSAQARQTGLSPDSI